MAKQGLLLDAGMLVALLAFEMPTNSFPDNLACLCLFHRQSKYYLMILKRNLRKSERLEVNQSRPDSGSSQ